MSLVDVPSLWATKFVRLSFVLGAIQIFGRYNHDQTNRCLTDCCQPRLSRISAATFSRRTRTYARSDRLCRCHGLQGIAPCEKNGFVLAAMGRQGFVYTLRRRSQLLNCAIPTIADLPPNLRCSHTTLSRSVGDNAIAKEVEDHT